MSIDRSPKSVAFGSQRGFHGSVGSGRNPGAYQQNKPLHCVVPIVEGNTFTVLCSRIAHRMVRTSRRLDGYCENHYDEAVAALKPLVQAFRARNEAYRDDVMHRELWDEGNLGARGPNIGFYKQVRKGRSF